MDCNIFLSSFRRIREKENRLSPVYRLYISGDPLAMAISVSQCVSFQRQSFVTALLFFNVSFRWKEWLEWSASSTLFKIENCFLIPSLAVNVRKIIWREQCHQEKKKTNSRDNLFALDCVILRLSQRLIQSMYRGHIPDWIVIFCWKLGLKLLPHYQTVGELLFCYKYTTQTGEQLYS